MQAILTLRASGGYSGHDLQRAAMLVASLDRHWADASAFRLTVIALDEDFDAIARHLHAERIEITIVRETDVLPCLKTLPAVPGWNKQQALKLAAHRLVEDPFYLVLDADIVCCHPFSESSLVIDGKALVDWESRMHHPHWWNGSAVVLRQSPELELMGLSVTPEVLSVAICTKLTEKIGEIHAMDSWEYLLTYRMWTEFSLYSMFAMSNGMMDQYHHSAEWMEQTGKSLRVQDNFWGAEDYPRWTPERSLAPDAQGIFMICQSNANVDPDELRTRLAPILEKAVPVA